MKTVTGSVISSDSISLSKATLILSKFASTENGSSQAVGAYLRRASAAFNELKSLHKELRVHSSDKRSRSEVTSARDDRTRISELTPANDARMEKNRDKDGYLEDREILETSQEEKRNKKKKNKKRNTAADSTENKIDEKVEHLQDGSEREEEKKVDKKKKRKDEEVGSEERKSKKKKKRQASE